MVDCSSYSEVRKQTQHLFLKIELNISISITLTPNAYGVILARLQICENMIMSLLSQLLSSPALGLQPSSSYHIHFC